MKWRRLASSMWMMWIGTTTTRGIFTAFFTIPRSLLEQDSFSFFYVTFTSRAVDGRVFMTWNYPFSYGMHLLPQTVMNKVDEELSVEELALSHIDFLGNQGDFELLPMEAEGLRAEIEKELRRQLEHNIARGILVRDKNEMIRYSVRGMFFLWGQFLREFVRFS